jgi:integrase
VLHDLRHTAAAILISNNMDVQSVAGVLGHADSTTTLNIYSYFFKSKNQEADNIMKLFFALLQSPKNKLYKAVGKQFSSHYFPTTYGKIA